MVACDKTTRKVKNNMAELKKNNVKVDVGAVAREDIPRFDVTPYIGKETTIKSADVYEGEYGYFLKVEGETVATIGTGDKLKEVKASAILKLFQNKEGKVIIGLGSTTDVFMQTMGAKNFKDLVGKKAIMVSKTGKDKKTSFLTFHGAQ